MKTKAIFFILSILFLLYCCEKDETSFRDNSCEKTETTFYKNDRISTWIKYSYINGCNVKIEESNGQITMYDYDTFGNIIKKTSIFESGSEFTNIYEFDNSNNEIKNEYYVSGQLRSYIIKNYIDSFLESIYYIDSSNDTTEWRKYVYKNNLRSRVETNNSDSYYYYSNEIDSIITVDKEEEFVSSKIYSKYTGSVKVYESLYNYNSSSDIIYYQIHTWDYDNEFLVRETQDVQNMFFDTRYVYENNLLKREESYLSSGLINRYQIYTYDDDDVLTRIDFFDDNDWGESYTIIESTCN